MGKYTLKLKSPPGWQLADAPAIAGAVRLTVAGVSPAKAPASLLVRAVSKGQDSFETYCQRELTAMMRAFPGGRILDLEGVGFPGKHWITQQVVASNENGPRSAILTLLEEKDHFVWFGMLINDDSWLEKAPLHYRQTLASYMEEELPESTSVGHIGLN